MPDEPYTDAAMPGQDAAKPGRGFDVDRLLAYALGLEDDPELAAAAAADGELGARLETVRAQAEAVGARVAAAVPAPAEDYTDLSSPRWAALGEFFDAPAPARSRSSRWLRVLAPALAVVVAVAIGAALIESRSDRGSVTSSERAESSKSLSVGAGAQDNAAPATAPGPAAEPIVSLSKEARKFATVVVARARAAAGGFQEFAVLRELKGHAAGLLRLRVGNAPAEAGKLHLLLLSPAGSAVAQAYNEPPPLISVSPAAATIAGSTPVPSPSASAGAGPSAPPSPAARGTTTPLPPADLSGWTLAEPTRTFGYHGQVALAEELPPGTDVASLSVP